MVLCRRRATTMEQRSTGDLLDALNSIGSTKGLKAYLDELKAAGIKDIADQRERVERACAMEPEIARLRAESTEVAFSAMRTITS